MEQQTIPRHRAAKTLGKYILVRVDEDRRRHIEEEAKRHNVTMSDILRFYVDEKMKEQGK